MKYLFAFTLLFTWLAGWCQDSAKAALYAGMISRDSLQQQLNIIAGPLMEGRETATAGQQKAAEYIAGRFLSAHLMPLGANDYQQTYPVFRDSLIREELVLNGDTLQYDKDFVVSGNSLLNLALSAEGILFVGSGMSDSMHNDYKNVDANGKIVLVVPGAPPAEKKGKKSGVPDYYTLQEAAKKNGAAALLIVDTNFPRTPLPRRARLYVNERKKDSVPDTFIISGAVAEKIMGTDYLATRKPAKKRLQSPKNYTIGAQLELNVYSGRLESSNVAGAIEGTDKKEEAVIITAHYDHLGKTDSLIFYGADDDGSGTVSVLELVRVFSAAAEHGARPRRTIIFMTVSGEEKGLWGSSYYSEHPLFPLDKTSADINIDMIGRVGTGQTTADSVNYVYVIGDNRLSSDLKKVSESVNAVNTHMILDYAYNAPDDPQRIYYRSDHYNFARKGVPVIFYFGGLHEDYHRPTDTPDKINYELLAKRVRLIFFTAWELANRNDQLKRDLPPAEQPIK